MSATPSTVGIGIIIPLVVTLTCGSLPATLLQEVTEDIAQARSVEAARSKGGPENNRVMNSRADAAPVPDAEATATRDARTVSRRLARGGQVCFEHWISQRGERAELAMNRTQIGGEYWYGWSMLIPEDFDHRGHYTIVMQLATWPSPRNGRFPAGANGSYMQITRDGQLVFVLQHAGEPGVDSVAKRFVIHPDITKARGRWFDFVMHAKWTGDPDGFLRFWVKYDDNHYEQKIAHQGRTFWNDEGHGPYFKMGLYTGDPNWGGPESIRLYTDEYRHGDAKADFNDVAPAGAAERQHMAGKGQARYVVYRSEVNQQDIPIIVYTPPGYDPTGARRYPVVYNLHGAGGGSPWRQWERVHRTLTRAMDTGLIEPLIYVFVNGLGSTGFIDSRSGGPQVYTSIVKELIPFIDANYRTIAARAGRAVDGFSMGGGGALMLAFKNPELFSAVVSYGGAVRASAAPASVGEPGARFADLDHFAAFSPWKLAERNADAIRAGLKVRLVCGDQDRLYEANENFKNRLAELHIPVDWVPVPGVAHDTKGLFDRTGVESLKFILRAFRQ